MKNVTYMCGAMVLGAVVALFINHLGIVFNI